MIREEDLHSSRDYSEGQKEAAHHVLIELVNLFNEYRDDIRIVGGCCSLSRNENSCPGQRKSKGCL